ncbi:MAG TPA: S8 family serine peptidase, partial [Chitinophagaceae bacterium]|nr:S8 family serine peptidase [Chitinophagaceae bacterium]
MNFTPGLKTNRIGVLFTLLISVAPFVSKAQNLKTTDFIMYGKKVQIATSSSVLAGAVGAKNLILTTGNVTFGGSLYSDSAVVLNNNNTVNGVVKANNTGAATLTTGTPITTGSGAILKDSVVAKGNINIKAGTVKQVFLPTGTTYTGPTPTIPPVQKVAVNLLKLPVMPPMPTTMSNGNAGTRNITKDTVIGPGSYGDLALPGGKTVTLSGAGTYIFNSIKNAGTTNNTFVFDFKGVGGNFIIHVVNDVNLNKNGVTLVNGGGANYIFLEAMGTGSTSNGNSFNLDPGSSGSSKWLGTVWAPNGNINLGSGTKNVTFQGALFTNNTINVASNISVDYAPYIVVQANNPLIIPDVTPGKVDNLIGQQLTDLFQHPPSTVTFEDSVFRVINSNVLIDIAVKPGQYNALLTVLKSSPFSLANNLFINTGNTSVITCFFPISKLDLLNGLTSYIQFVQPVFPPKKLGGVATTNGDIAQRSNAVRSAYQTFGENVKVGVLSDSYNNLGLASADVANDDLPGNAVNPTPVDMRLDYPFTVFGGGSDEGRAMLQIVHDVAPKAALAFRTGFISETDFAFGVRQLADDANCDVVIDDITWVTQPFFRDGFVAQAANYVHDHGKTYISAAGNFAGQAYSAPFNPVPAPNGMSGFAHNFNTGGAPDIYQHLTVAPGIYTVVLQWDNNFYSLGQANPTLNDLDIYLVDDNGAILFGMNGNNAGKDPIEVLSFHVIGNAPTTTNIMVVCANGSTTARFKYIIMRGNATIMEYNSVGNSTIVGQANATGALAVGAVRYTRTPAYTPGAPTIETFSSVGRTPVNGVLRNKPDFCAPDGGNTTVDFHSLDIEGDGEPNFFGTSAAAPHAGGVVALLISGSKKFRGTGMPPDEVKSRLISTAIDMTDIAGYDSISGAGLIQADRAMNTFAAPTPGLITVTVPPDITGPTPSTFTFTVTGHFFDPSSTVYERDQALTTTIINDSTATAIVNGFSGNPAIRVYTPPRANGDGGFSNSINLLNIPRKKVVITAENKSKLYGEPLPAFTNTITVDNVPLASSGLTLTDLGLNGRLQDSTPANSLSDATNWNIVPIVRPRFDTAHSLADKALFELYDYDSVNGKLTINKLPLT